MQEALSHKNEEHNIEMENTDAKIALLLEKIVLLARQNFDLEYEMSTHDVTQKAQHDNIIEQLQTFIQRSMVKMIKKRLRNDAKWSEYEYKHDKNKRNIIYSNMQQIDQPRKPNNSELKGTLS